MNIQKPTMKPQDVVVLLKIISLKNKPWSQLSLAGELFMSQSEVSQSIARSKYAGLLHTAGKTVFALALMEFLQYGIRTYFHRNLAPFCAVYPHLIQHRH